MKNEVKNIQSISVIAKEWFDKTYGNSYFSARLVVTLKNGSTVERAIPFQYGYGDTYLHAAQKELGIVFECSQDGSITWFATKHEKCLQRDVKAWGKN